MVADGHTVFKLFVMPLTQEPCKINVLQLERPEDKGRVPYASIQENHNSQSQYQALENPILSIREIGIQHKL